MQREKFEEWARREGLDLRRSADGFDDSMRKDFPDALYVSGATNWAFAAWQAAYVRGMEVAKKIFVDEVASSTGPTGGWLDSPKAIAASIAKRIAEESTNSVPEVKP
jgi:hypothetical protein